MFLSLYWYLIVVMIGIVIHLLYDISVMIGRTQPVPPLTTPGIRLTRIFYRTYLILNGIHLLMQVA